MLLNCGTFPPIGRFDIGRCDMVEADDDIFTNGVYFHDQLRVLVEWYKMSIQDVVSNTLNRVPIHCGRLNGSRELSFAFLVGVVFMLNRSDEYFVYLGAVWSVIGCIG